jgi:hypothetical protein
LLISTEQPKNRSAAGAIAPLLQFTRRSVIADSLCSAMLATKGSNMKQIDKDELFDNLHSFLKSKGVELREGSYQNGVKNACSLLADAVNLGQHGLERAKTEMDKRLDQMRQYVHEQTAPRSASQASAEPTAPKASTKSAASQARPKGAKPAARKSKKKATRR